MKKFQFKCGVEDVYKLRCYLENLDAKTEDDLCNIQLKSREFRDKLDILKLIYEIYNSLEEVSPQ